jgi:hypothetical protein
MTSERRLLFGLDEIKAVTFQCTRCSGRVSIAPNDVAHMPDSCPLGHRWDFYTTAGQHGPSGRLVTTIKAVLELEQQPTANGVGFVVRLEFEEPNATR